MADKAAQQRKNKMKKKKEEWKKERNDKNERNYESHREWKLRRNQRPTPEAKILMNTILNYIQKESKSNNQKHTHKDKKEKSFK
jgi:hypothetical protein